MTSFGGPIRSEKMDSSNNLTPLFFGLEPVVITTTRVRHVHANKMRKFHVCVQSCNIISENDVDFGRVLVPAIVLPSVDVDRSKIEHLDPEQQSELLALYDEFAECFSDKPGLCRVAE